MNSIYFKLLLKKMDKAPLNTIETDLNSWSQKPMKYLTIKLFTQCEIKIICEEDGFKIIMIDTVQRVDSFIAFPFTISWLSLSWHRWRILARKLEKIHANQQMLEKEKQKEISRLEKLKNKQNVDHMMITIFPEIIEKALLGDDDDK